MRLQLKHKVFAIMYARYLCCLGRVVLTTKYFTCRYASVFENAKNKDATEKSNGKRILKNLIMFCINHLKCL
jgi:hypothetical protein